MAVYSGYARHRTPAPTRGPAVSVRLLGAAGLLLLAVAVTYVALVWTPAGQRWENQLLAEAQGAADSGWAWQLLALVGSPLVVVVGMTAVFAVGLLRRVPWAGVAGGAVVVVSVLLAEVLKTAVLPRPLFDAAGAPSHNSFPSGHVTVAAALVAGLVVALPGRVRLLVVLPGAALVAAVAVATMTAGWHRVSDTVGGALLAAAVGCAAAAIPTGRR